MKIFNRIFTLSLFFISSLVSAEQPLITIERYQPERDKETIVKIIKNHPHELDYATLGYPEDHTEKFLENTKYITEVIRVNNVTVGFVNYAIWDVNILTFNLGRKGLLHLLGIDANYQRQGLGRILLQHALAKIKSCYPDSITICTKRSNTAACHLYEKEGFVLIYPAKTDTLSEDFIYNMPLEIPADKLPQGNLIQRYPKTVLALAGLSIGALLFWK